ncbi:aldehyde dehydrogenase family protein [Blastomonas sp. AAP53]|uniref:aldehyde dehydrogenase family protein n=1 Tax=Blastomonas sp. AAP53 TaxID=1248760 RepID=UPI000307D687|nr:aldehyde dehydrogenase family protein [Blastomonas sp. AAP53]
MTTEFLPYKDMDGQFIAGQWRAGRSGKVLPNHNPYDSGLLGEISLASESDLDEAYQAAAAAQRSWGKSLHSERSALFLRVLAILDQRKDEIIGWIVRETGSTLLKATAEWGAVRAGTMEAVALPSRVEGKIMPIDVPGKQSFVYREPLGVIGVISPWNFPMVLSNRSIAPALALGNAVVVKPAEDTPVTGGLLLAKIYEEAGLAAGLLNVVVGDVADIGDAFTLHPIPKLISFTGSTRVGKRIAEMAATGTRLKHVGLELGGNAPFVVLDDADLDLAVGAAAFGRFLHNGQICMSTNRIIVDASIFDAFVEKFVAHVKTFKTGDPSDPDTVIGPLINGKQKAAALRNIAAARAAGFTEVLGGEADGLMVPPHIFVNVPNDSPFAQTEQFAPIAPIIRAANEDDALRLANETEFGLSSAVFTRDVARGVRFARGIEAGMTHVNDISVLDSPFNMFGGEKNSGIGRFNGDWVIAEMTTDHWITVQDGARHYPF